VKTLIEENSDLKARMEDTYKIEYLENEKNELRQKVEEQGANLEEISEKMAKIN
jgi:predicted nuclease with TOPRIM domain